MVQEELLVSDYIINALPLIPFDAITVDGYIWFSATGFNGLCRTEPKTGETKFVGCFLEEKHNQIFLHSQVRCYEKKLIFAPNFSNGIDIYDIEKKQFFRIPLPDDIIGMCHECDTKTYAMEQRGHQFVLFGFKCAVIILFDILSCQMKVIRSIYDKHYEFAYNKKAPFFRKTACIVDNEVYALCAQSPHILKINILTGSYEMIDTSGELFNTICYDGEFFWLSRNNEIYRMNDYEYEKVSDVNSEYLFFLSECIGDYIYYIPLQQEEIVVFNKNSFVEKKIGIKCRKDILGVGEYSNAYNAIRGEEGKIMLISNKANNIFYIDNGEMKEKMHLVFRQSIPELEKVIELLLEVSEEPPILCEENIEMFLKYLSIYKKLTIEEKKQEVNIGARIYKAIVES